jgi:hypothetical protein
MIRGFKLIVDDGLEFAELVDVLGEVLGHFNARRVCCQASFCARNGGQYSPVRPRLCACKTTLWPCITSARGHLTQSSR